MATPTAALLISLSLAAAPSPPAKAKPAAKPDPKAAAKGPVKKPVVAIVPFTTSSGPEYRWIGHGAAELIGQSLLVADAASVVPVRDLNGLLRRYDLTRDDIGPGPKTANVAKALGADVLITGSFQAQWPEIQLTLRLVDGNDGRVLQSVWKLDTLDKLIPILEEATQQLAKLGGWAAPATNALGTPSLYAFREASLASEILALQQIGPKQRTTIPEGSLKRAKLHAERAVALDPKWSGGLGCLALSEVLLEPGPGAGRLETALALWERAKAGTGRSSNAVLAAYLASFKKNDNDKALDVLSRAVERTPGDLGLIAVYGETLQALDKHSEALAVFASYTERAPLSPYGMVKVGKSLARVGQGDAALEITSKAVERAPWDSTFTVELGSRQIDLDKRAEAEKSLLHAIELDRRDARAYLRLGYLHLISGKPDKAVTVLERAIAESDLDDEWRARAMAHFDLARAHAKMKANDKAFEQLDKAVAAGFRDKKRLEEEQDLAPLSKDPRWAVIAARLE